jgi:hypothetical protein
MNTTKSTPHWHDEADMDAGCTRAMKAVALTVDVDSGQHRQFDVAALAVLRAVQQFPEGCDREDMIAAIIRHSQQGVQ